MWQGSEVITAVVALLFPTLHAFESKFGLDPLDGVVEAGPRVDYTDVVKMARSSDVGSQRVEPNHATRNRSRLVEPHRSHVLAFDYKVRELTKRFGKIGETRLMVMASLLIADEIHELNKKLETNIEKINSLEANIGSKDKELTDQKKESQEYIDISNDRLTDLLSRLSLVN